MTATIQLDGELLKKEINVENGLRQSCCMAPALFNLYTCLLMERWYARTVESDRIGIALRFKCMMRNYLEGIQGMQLKGS